MVPKSKGYIGKFDEEVAQRIFEQWIGALSPIGVLGDARGATPGNGKMYLDDLAAAIVEFIQSS